MFGTHTVSLLIALFTSLSSHTCTAAKLIFLNFIMIMSFPCSESFSNTQGPESCKSIALPMRSHGRLKPGPVPLYWEPGDCSRCQGGLWLAVMLHLFISRFFTCKLKYETNLKLNLLYDFYLLDLFFHTVPSSFLFKQIGLSPISLTCSLLSCLCASALNQSLFPISTCTNPSLGPFQWPSPLP